MYNIKDAMLLYAVTDQKWTGQQTLYQQIEQAIKGGITCVQLREKNLEEAEFIAEAKQVAALCKKHGVPLIINDNLKVAIACGADGVHLGQQDCAAAEVRKQVGNDMIIGVSVHNVSEALQAVADGADYLGAGAVFSTATKRDASALPLETLRDICKSVAIPVVAIGGIGKENIFKLQGSGIAGVAVVSAIFAAENCETAARELLPLCSKIVTE